MDTTHLVYLHGLESDSNSGKACQFREWFLGMVPPNFKGTFEEQTNHHRTLDTIVPLEPVREIAQKLFTNLTYYIIEDDHRLHKTAQDLDWQYILN